MEMVISDKVDPGKEGAFSVFLHLESKLKTKEYRVMEGSGVESECDTDLWTYFGEVSLAC